MEVKHGQLHGSMTAFLILERATCKCEADCKCDLPVPKVKRPRG